MKTTQEEFLSPQKLSKLGEKFRREHWFIIEPRVELVCLVGLGGLIALLPTLVQHLNPIAGVLVVALSCIGWFYAFFEFEIWLREYLWKKYLRKKSKGRTEK